MLGALFLLLVLCWHSALKHHTCSTQRLLLGHKHSSTVALISKEVSKLQMLPPTLNFAVTQLSMNDLKDINLTGNSICNGVKLLY